MPGVGAERRENGACKFKGKTGNGNGDIGVTRKKRRRKMKEHASGPKAVVGGPYKLWGD